MLQILNTVAVLLLCGSAATTGKRLRHAGVIGLSLAVDLGIAITLHLQRGVIGRASNEMAMPIKALHIGSAVLGLLMVIACLGVALWRWRKDLPIGPWGMALLGSTILVRCVAFASSFLMKML